MKSKIIFLIILAVGIFLRFYQLGHLPNSYTPDELAQGYTAYSILQTGRDEWGSQNLIFLKSFGDYKLPFQTWLMIPSVKLFGLTPFAVRFPNALFSVVALISLYYLVKKIFPNHKSAPLISFCLFALSPWSIPLSRIALEANLVVSLFIIALTLFFYRRLFFSALFFSLCFYTYHSAKVFLPPFLLVLLLLNFSKKNLSLFVFIAIFLIPLFLSSSAQPSRTTDIAIFNPTDKWSSVADSRFTLSRNGLPDPISRLSQNKVTYTLRQFSQNYLSYFSPQFLLTNGAGETTYGMLPGFGVLGIITTLGLLIFLVQLLRNKLKITPTIIILLTGLFISPLPAALAKGSYSANRVSLLIPFALILSSLGLSFIKKQAFVYLFIISESLFFTVNYFYSANQVLAEGMLYGHQQVNQYISDLKPSKIIYSRKLSEPQAYYLFFQKTDPRLVQENSASWREFEQKHLSFLDQLGEYKLDNVVFKEISLPQDTSTPRTLLIGRPEEFPSLKPTFIINYPFYSQSKAAIYLYLSP